MAGPVGGRRTRLIREALYRKTYNGLDTLDWFNPARKHLPVTYVQKSIPGDQEVKPNAIGLDDGPTSDTGLETGSNLSEQRLNYYIDVYAESSAVGLDLAGDLKDILQGRFSTTLGVSGPWIDVYDYSLATPTLLFGVEVDRVVIDKPEFSSYLKPWRENYYALAVTLLDTYADEDYQ